MYEERASGSQNGLSKSILVAKVTTGITSNQCPAPHHVFLPRSYLCPMVLD